MSKERSEPRLVYRDFYEYWEARFIDAGYPEDYVQEEFSRYRETGKNEEVWPEGETQFKRSLHKAFMNVLGDSEKV